jgi:hypothetical protein
VANNSYVVACVLVAAGDTHWDWREELMKYGAVIGLGAMIYVRSFIKIGCDIQKLNGEEIHRHTESIEIA